MNPTKITSLLLLCTALTFAGCASEPESHLVTAPPPAAPGTTPAPQQVVVVAQSQPVVAVAATPTSTNSYIVMQAPPAPQPPEAIPAQPSSQHVWVAGYWTWQNGRYAWMAGHWEVPPYHNAKWNNPRWESEGNAFRFYEGYWN